MSRRLKLFGHPLHPPTVHLPLGLLIVVPLWDALALWRGGEWWSLSFWTLAAGLSFSLLSVATGLMDYMGVDKNHPGEKVIILHLGMMATAVTFDVASLLVRGGPPPLTGIKSAWAVGLALLSAGLLSLGGWFGGHLVYHYKIGVDEK